MFVNNQLQIKETLGSCGIFAAILMTQCRCQFLALPIAAIFGGLQIINNLCQNGVFHKQAKKSHYQNPYFQFISKIHSGGPLPSFESLLLSTCTDEQDYKENDNDSSSNRKTNDPFYPSHSSSVLTLQI